MLNWNLAKRFISGGIMLSVIALPTTRAFAEDNIACDFHPSRFFVANPDSDSALKAAGTALANQKKDCSKQTEHPHEFFVSSEELCKTACRRAPETDGASTYFITQKNCETACENAAKMAEQSLVAYAQGRKNGNSIQCPISEAREPASSDSSKNGI